MGSTPQYDKPDSSRYELDHTKGKKGDKADVLIE